MELSCFIKLGVMCDIHWKLHPVKPDDMLQTLKLATDLLGPQHGFLSQHVSGTSLHAARAMNLCCTCIDLNIIQLLGH